MTWIHVIWDETPGGNVQHVEEHDLTAEDIEHVLETTDQRASAVPVAAHAYSDTHRTVDISSWFTTK
jgi:hypothetical protein